MSSKKRTYNDVCGLAHAMELVGERWALLVLRELAFGPKRFTDIRAGLPSASPNVLSQRLRELETAGVLRRRKLAPPAGSWVYELTEWGAELEPTLRDLGRWAARSPHFPEDGNFSPDAMAMSMKTMFDASLAVDFAGTFELRFGEQSFRIEVAEESLTVEAGGAENADAVITTTPGTWVGVIYQDRAVEDAEKAGELEIEGDRDAALRLTKLYTLPEPVELEVAPA